MVSDDGRPRDIEAELVDRRDGLAARLDQIRRSRSEQDAIAERSYWHPNGFIKLLLDDRPRVGQLRLHVWPELPVDDDIHGHAWHYESVVVGGELREIRYHETESNEGQPIWRHSYGVVGHRRFTLGDPCLVRLAQREHVDLRPGDRSGGMPGYVHRFFATFAPAVTMLRVGPIVNPTSFVYRAEAVPLRAVVPRPTTRADVAEWVDHVFQITGAPAHA